MVTVLDHYVFFFFKKRNLQFAKPPNSPDLFSPTMQAINANSDSFFPPFNSDAIIVQFTCSPLDAAECRIMAAKKDEAQRGPANTVYIRVILSDVFC